MVNLDGAGGLRLSDDGQLGRVGAASFGRDPVTCIFRERLTEYLGFRDSLFVRMTSILFAEGLGSRCSEVPCWLLL